MKVQDTAKIIEQKPSSFKRVRPAPIKKSVCPVVSRTS